SFPPVPTPACIDSSESYYEEAQPYEETVNGKKYVQNDGEAVSSSYESYDEEEVTRGKSPSAQHQWPSAEASIELMKDARICAFLWRKKWLGQWAKQLCVIKEHRLLCYKSSKEQTPLLDVSLLGCSVVYKEKQLKRKEHKLKIIPVGGEAIVLGLQSKEQTEQWLKVTHSHRVTLEQFQTMQCKLLRLSYFVSLPSKASVYSGTVLLSKGSKKETSYLCFLLHPLSGYLNVLVNSQWRTCWCLIKNGQLWFYQDKGKNKVTQPAVTLEGCSVLPDPSPEHLYSFRIDMDGTQMATLEAKTSADMGHWLGLLLSQTGSKTDPEELTYDYVNAERISTIVNAKDNETCSQDAKDPEGTEEDPENRIYLDLVPVRSFLHTSSGGKVSPAKEASRHSPVKLGKNRTEADLRRYIDERDRLEKEREEVKISLANLKKEKREIKEELSACQGTSALPKEEACREAEQHRVEVELQLVQVKENLKKVESGPFTLGTTLDSTSPVNSASALKARPTSMMTTKGKVLQKAKVRFLYTIKASMSAS
uniref:Actin filament-associated protein 1-like 2 n=1 Tax=Amphilophus citrinellus TaxID=61819 RepID=A0A3Q0RU91_AMPCI